MRIPQAVRRALMISTFLMLALLTGCPSDPEAEPPVACLDGGVTQVCTPAYEPTYDQIFATTLQPTCAKSGVSCHAPQGPQGGLDFADKESSYTRLLQRAVRPGSPECSLLVQRIIATDGRFRMPPGRSISEGEQCAIIQWVAGGAPR